MWFFSWCPKFICSGLSFWGFAFANRLFFFNKNFAILVLKQILERQDWVESRNKSDVVSHTVILLVVDEMTALVSTTGHLPQWVRYTFSIYQSTNFLWLICFYFVVVVVIIVFLFWLMSWNFWTEVCGNCHLRCLILSQGTLFRKPTVLARCSAVWKATILVCLRSIHFKVLSISFSVSQENSFRNWFSWWCS